VQFVCRPIVVDDPLGNLLIWGTVVTGKPMGTILTKEEMVQVIDKLIEIKTKHARAFFASYGDMSDAFARNEVTVSAIGWEAVAVWTQAKGKTIKYTIPKEGTGMFMDCLCIPKDAPNIELSYKMINHVISADPQKQFATEQSAGITNLDAVPMLPKELADSYNYADIDGFMQKARLQPVPLTESAGRSRPMTIRPSISAVESLNGSRLTGRPAVDRRNWLLAPAALIFLGAFVAPLVHFLVISFWSVKARIMRPDLTIRNYIVTWTDYYDVIGSTLLVALTIGALTTVIAFGYAYSIRFKCGRLEAPLLFLALITLFGGYLVKIYAWKSILGREGILNQFLLWTGIIDQPLNALLYSVNGVVITLTYFLLPFAILPIYGNLRAIRPATIEAARDLGAGRWAVMRDIVIPQCEKGIAIAFTFAFLITAGDYVTPRFVGGGAAMMGHFIELQFSLGFNWPQGSAMAFTIMAVSLALVALLRALLRRALRP
jgi:spermidine/putrescine transport system permease protein